MIETEIHSETIVERKQREFEAETETEVSLLDLLILILKRKRFILRFVAGATALAIVVSLLLPVRYEGKIVLLPPQQNSSIGSSLLGQLGNMGALGSLATLAGGRP